MYRIKDAIGAVVITALVVYITIQLLKPYVPYLLIGAAIVVAVVIGRHVYQSRRYW